MIHQMMSKYAEDIFRKPAVLRKKLDMYLKTLIWVVCGVFTKYSVCMNFLKCLEMQDDEMLSIQGGTNDWVIYIAIIFIVAIFSICMFAAL